MPFKLDNKQQELIIQDLKSREVSEDLLDAVAGGIIMTLPNRYPYTATTLAIGEETPPWMPLF